MAALFGSQTAVRRALGLADDGHPADALASAARQREGALNRERVLRSAVEFVVEESADDRLVEVCQAALDDTEAGS